MLVNLAIFKLCISFNVHEILFTKKKKKIILLQVFEKLKTFLRDRRKTLCDNKVRLLIWIY